MKDVKTGALFAGSYYTKSLGALLMFKSCIPVLAVFFLLLGAWIITGSVNRSLEEMHKEIDPKIEQAEKQIEKIRDEGRRLVNEVKKIENETIEIVGDVKKSVEPIRKSLLGLAGAMRTTSNSIESIINGIIKVVNGVPGIKMKKVNLPNVRVPGLKLPHLKLDVNLDPDLAAVKEFQKLSDEVAERAAIALKEIIETIVRWWWTVTIVLYLILIWIFLTLVGVVARSRHRFEVGWKLFKGEDIDAGLELL